MSPINTLTLRVFNPLCILYTEYSWETVSYLPLYIYIYMYMYISSPQIILFLFLHLKKIDVSFGIFFFRRHGVYIFFTFFFNLDPLGPE